MVVMSEKAMNILLVVAGVFVLGAGVAILATQADVQVEIPSTDFFGMLGNLFEFLEVKVGLAGQQTREWFCQKDLQDAIDLCEITPGMLKEYCEMVDEEKIGACQTPTDEIKRFCKQSWNKREDICKEQNQFNAACDEIRVAGDITSMKDLPFCK